MVHRDLPCGSRVTQPAGITSALLRYQAFARDFGPNAAISKLQENAGDMVELSVISRSGSQAKKRVLA